MMEDLRAEVARREQLEAAGDDDSNSTTGEPPNVGSLGHWEARCAPECLVCLEGVYLGVPSTRVPLRSVMGTASRTLACLKPSVGVSASALDMCSRSTAAPNVPSPTRSRVPAPSAVAVVCVCREQQQQQEPAAGGQQTCSTCGKPHSQQQQQQER